MFCFPLTNWITMRGPASAGAKIVQSESQWLDLRGFEDIVCWLQCQEVSVGGATNVQLTYQTSPTKDELLFTAAATAINLASALGPVVTKATMAGVSGSNSPLARWLRWQLAISGTPTSAWDATFRIWIAANIGPHKLRPNTPSPPLRPNGKSCNGDCQKGGSKPAAGTLLSTRFDTPPSGNTSQTQRARLVQTPWGVMQAQQMQQAPRAGAQANVGGPSRRRLPDHIAASTYGFTPPISTPN